MSDYKFDLYFAGSRHKEYDDYILAHNANSLFSQQYQRSAIKKWLECKGNSTGKLLIDSGAYTVFKSGKTLDIDDYINYVNVNSDNFNYFIQVDDMPGKYGRPATDEEKLLSPKKSWDNFLYMIERVKCPRKLLPVFHNGEDYKWLKNMVEYTYTDGDKIDYICLSPMHNVGLDQRDLFIGECFKIIKASNNPNVKVHALGVTRLNVLEKYPFTSADSTSWILTAATGSIFTEYGTVCVSNRENAEGSCLSFSKEFLEQLEEYIHRFGYTLEELSASYRKRALFNIKYFLHWCENYKYTPQEYTQESLF